jgi:hypothetical protein
MEKIDQMSDICAIGLCVWMFASWLTHIITCLADGSWGFLVAGALFFPVAWIHGTGVWLGVW